MGDWTKLTELSDIIFSSVFRGTPAFLIFHDDADGCSSASIIRRLISERSSCPLLGFSAPEKHSVDLTATLIQKILDKKPRIIISLDLPLRDSIEDFGQLLDRLDAKMLVYDHHIPTKHINWPTRCIQINPRDLGFGNIPAAYYSFLIYKHYKGKHDLCWVAAVGVVADYCTNYCRDLIREVKLHYPYLYPYTEINQTSAILSPLMKIGDLLNAGYQHSSDSSGATIAVKALEEAIKVNDPNVLLRGTTEYASTLHRYRKEVDHELNMYLRKFNSEAEFHLNSGLALYSIEPKYEIVSVLASRLQHLHSKKVIAVTAPMDSNLMKISLRKGKEVRIDLADLANRTTSKLESASGGGHPDAAGCVIRLDDIDLWKKEVVDYLRKSLLHLLGRV